MATVSYGLKITNAYHVFDATLRIYRDAVRYFMEIASLHYEELILFSAVLGTLKTA